MKKKFSAPLGVNFFSFYTPPVSIFCHLRGWIFFSSCPLRGWFFFFLSRFEGELFFFLKLPNHPLDIYWCVPKNNSLVTFSLNHIPYTKKNPGVGEHYSQNPDGNSLPLLQVWFFLYQPGRANDNLNVLFLIEPNIRNIVRNISANKSIWNYSWIMIDPISTNGYYDIFYDCFEMLYLVNAFLQNMPCGGI